MSNNSIKYYNSRTQELDHKGIIKAIKIAGENYKRGYAIECHDSLKEIITAIEQCMEDRLK